MTGYTRVRLTARYPARSGPSFSDGERIALPDDEAEYLVMTGKAVLDDDSYQPDSPLSPEEVKTMDTPTAHKMIERTRATRKGAR